MLMITLPLFMLIAILSFLFNVLYLKQHQLPHTASITNNFLLYHDGIYAYANDQSQLTDTIINQNNVTFLQNINFTSRGNYQSVIVENNNTRYLIDSFDTINNSTLYANQAIHAINEALAMPQSAYSENYQIQVVLVNNNCVPSILTQNINIDNYSNLFSTLCNKVEANLNTSIGKYVLMEPLQ